MQPISHSIRRLALAGAAVLVLGGAAVGIAAAQAQPATTPSGQQSGYQRFIDALAKRLNISTQTLETAVTQARSDAGLPAGGQGFPGGGRGGRGPRGFGFELDAAATAIGITPEQLRTELPGKSLAQVAQAHGKNATDVATALKNAAHQRIDQAVTSGKLTADQANPQKQQADQRIDQFVNQTLPQAAQVVVAASADLAGYAPALTRPPRRSASRLSSCAPSCPASRWRRLRRRTARAALTSRPRSRTPSTSVSIKP